MRKWLLIGAATTAFAIVGGVWYYTTREETNAGWRLTSRGDVVWDQPSVKHDGDSETSDTIEPLVVERSVPVVQSVEPPVDDAPMARVVLTLGMTQPPRPDSEPGKALRMPYADEEEIFGLLLNPIGPILEPDLTRLNVFDEIEKANPAEESENKEMEPEPLPPLPDYHHHYQHCPYSGGCPAPYPYRTKPR